MRKLLTKMGWLDHRGRWDWFEFNTDITILAIMGIAIYIGVQFV